MLENIFYMYTHSYIDNFINLDIVKIGEMCNSQ